MSHFCQKIAANLRGRDFVVGDLHGCLDLLYAQLELVAFDRNTDRLFSVGDLVDRGPDSIGCLRLLREPWFFSVRGNHDDMLVEYCYRSDGPDSSLAMHYFHNGGNWVRVLDTATEHELHNDLLPRLSALPYVITVGDGFSRFHVVHAELVPRSANLRSGGFSLAGASIPWAPLQVLTDNLIVDEVVSGMTQQLIWGRQLVARIKAENCRRVATPVGTLLVSEQSMYPGLSLTYVGHTPQTTMCLFESHLFIDRGAYIRNADSCLLMLCHNDVCSWLV